MSAIHEPGPDSCGRGVLGVHEHEQKKNREKAG